MKTLQKQLSKADFSFIVKNTPLVSIDLIVRNEKKEILVGLRNNEPAKGYWFVPGGRILKNETIKNAFERITEAELGEKIIIEHSQKLGVFEHLYDTNFTESPDFGTHYIVLAYQVSLESSLEGLPKEQHKDYKWISQDKFRGVKIHHNTKVYLEL